MASRGAEAARKGEARAELARRRVTAEREVVDFIFDGDGWWRVGGGLWVIRVKFVDVRKSMIILECCWDESLNKLMMMKTMMLMDGYWDLIEEMQGHFIPWLEAWASRLGTLEDATEREEAVFSFHGDWAPKHFSHMIQYGVPARNLPRTGMMLSWPRKALPRLMMRVCTGTSTYIQRTAGFSWSFWAASLYRYMYVIISYTERGEK
jgi:hypothetical protein